MSKEKACRVSAGYSYLIMDYVNDRVIAKTMRIIEAIGLPDKQEQSIKELIKDGIYQELHSKEVYLDSSITDAVLSAYHKQDANVPHCAVKLEDLN